MNKIIAFTAAALIGASSVAIAAPAVFPSTSETAQTKENEGKDRSGEKLGQNNDRRQ
jgi:uncharacterized low-complexity protein